MGYQNPQDIWSNTNGTQFAVGSSLTITSRSQISKFIVRGIDSNNNVYWLNSSAGNVSALSPNNCNELPIDNGSGQFLDSLALSVILESDYRVILRAQSGYNWSDAEIREIFWGTYSTALAFKTISSTQDQRILFKKVMTDGDQLPYIVVYKGGYTNPTLPLPNVQYQVVPLTQSYSIDFPNTAPYGGCLTIHGTGSSQTSSPIPRTIVCNFYNNGQSIGLVGNSGIRPFTEYVLVHEMGHVLDNRTVYSTTINNNVVNKRLLNDAFDGLYSSTCPSYLASYLIVSTPLPSPIPQSTPLSSPTPRPSQILTCTTILDSQYGLVMGLNRYGFARGERGWGTGPSTDFTDFQQNPRNDIEEITADMVLNWVYRTIWDTWGQWLSKAPGDWLGYLNLSWEGDNGPIATGTVDLSFPGDSRFRWMNAVLKVIFIYKGW